MNKSGVHSVKLPVTIALLSVCLISYQLLLIQVLSIVQWYHFAYMIISVALLGFGAAGTFLTIFQKQIFARFETVLPFLIITTALLMTVSVSLSQTELFYFDSYRIFSETTDLWKLLVSYIIFFLPFFSGALVIGMVFIKNVERIGIFYFANMLGSGIGGAAALFLMWISFPEKLPAVLSVIVFLSGLLIVSKRLPAGFIIYTVLTAAVISFIYLNPPELRLSEYKSLSKTLNLPETKIIETKSSPYGLLHLVSSPYLRYAPGLSLTYPEQVVVNNAAFNNGEWLGPLIHSEEGSKNYFRSSTEYLPYAAGAKKDILILNAGTGRQISNALMEGGESITAVEPDIMLLGLLTGNYAYMVDSIYTAPQVHIENFYPRTYLLSTDQKFDLIQLPVIDAFGGTSGMYALQEQYLLTKESFGEMYSRLNEDGLICISTWIDYPYKNPLKIIATIAEILEENGIEDITSHTAAVKNWNTLTIIVKREPFDKAEPELIRNFCRKMKFDPVILPGIDEEERDYYNRLQDKSFYTYIDRLIESKDKREELYSEYTFNIKPATDNKPYYSQFLKWNSIAELSEAFGDQSVPFFEVGYILLYLTFIQIILLAVILIILPLFKIGWKGKNKWGTLLYFSGLGLGYISIEIVLIQKFTLYFGNVIYAAAAVVSLMLIASGLGSLVSQKIKLFRGRIIGVLVLIVISLIMYTILLTPLLKATIIFGLPVKAIFASLLIAPPAFIMGIPFPLGLRLLAKSTGGETAWAWGINGVFSVTGTVLATVIALELGFVWVMIFAVLAYIGALISRLK